MRQTDSAALRTEGTTLSRTGRDAATDIGVSRWEVQSPIKSSERGSITTLAIGIDLAEDVLASAFEVAVRATDGAIGPALVGQPVLQDDEDQLLPVLPGGQS